MTLLCAFKSLFLPNIILQIEGEGRMRAVGGSIFFEYSQIKFAK